MLRNDHSASGHAFLCNSFVDMMKFADPALSLNTPTSGADLSKETSSTAQLYSNTFENVCAHKSFRDIEIRLAEQLVQMSVSCSSVHIGSHRASKTCFVSSHNLRTVPNGSD